jgi:hypothetical protein
MLETKLNVTTENIFCTKTWIPKDRWYPENTSQRFLLQKQKPVISCQNQAISTQDGLVALLQANTLNVTHGTKRTRDSTWHQKVTYTAQNEDVKSEVFNSTAQAILDSDYIRWSIFQEQTKAHLSRALVVHACNPSYSGGSDREDWGSKPAWRNSSWDPIS